MSDPNPPNPNAPGSGVPPKPPEAAKVQPKKETVRISLPPKPAASPTIKLPTLPAGGPAAPPGSAPAGPTLRPPTAVGVATPAPASAAPSARPPTNTGAQVSRPVGAGAGPSAGRGPVPASARRGVSGLDVGLAIAAAVVGLGAIAVVALLLQIK